MISSLSRAFLFLSFAFLCHCSCNGDWSVQLPASSNTIQDSYDVSISGSAGIYGIDLTSNSGTVTQGNRVTNVVSNFQIPWDDKTLYAFIGADSTGIMMGWAYCSGSQLDDLWLEDTTGQAGFTNPKVTGTCSIRQSPKNVALSTSQNCYDINSPSNTPTINGDDLKLSSGAPGSVVLDGSTYDLLPFAIVDCTTCTSTTLDGGWIEVHAVMRSDSNICLGIYYLQVIPKDTIPLNYINCFFSTVADTQFKAQYQLSSGSSTTATVAQTTETSGLAPIMSTGAAAATTTSKTPNSAGTTNSAQNTAAAATTTTAASNAASSTTAQSTSLGSTSTSNPTGSNSEATRTLALYPGIFMVLFYIVCIAW